MSKEIIKVLEYLSEKIGLVIDWSAANVYPQVMEVLTRYRTMKIIELALGMLVGLIFGALAIWCWRILRADKKLCASNRANTRYYRWLVGSQMAYLDEGEGLIAGVVICGGLALMTCLFAGSDLMKWIFVPELQYYDLLTSMIGG